MTKYVLWALVAVLFLEAGSAQAQTTNPVPPVQSLRPSQSACGAGSQSIRVCNDDFRSCSSICTATALDPSAVTAGCSLEVLLPVQGVPQHQGLPIAIAQLLLRTAQPGRGVD